MQSDRLKSIVFSFARQDWFVLVLLVGLLGGLYSTVLTRMNKQTYEVEDLRSSFTGKIDFEDPLASNTQARYIDVSTPNDNGQAIFFGPYVNLDEGSYQASFALRSSEVISQEQPLLLDVVSRGGKEVLASREVNTQELNTNSYQRIVLDFSLDVHTPGVEFRAFYPDQGGYWFDYVSVRRKTAWDMAWLQWPLFAMLLGALLEANHSLVSDGIPINKALSNRNVQHKLVILSYLTLLGIGLYVLGSKYKFAIDRIIYAYIPDDAFYYFETIANLARRGRLSFDGLTFGNGFHPLWGVVLTPIYWLGLDKTDSFLAGLVLADIIGLASVVLLFRTLEKRFNVFLAFGLSFQFFSQARHVIQYGLETAVLLASYIALIYWYDTRFKQGFSRATSRDSGFLGFLLGLVFLARLDHAIFVVVFLGWVLASNVSDFSTGEGKKKLVVFLGAAAGLAIPYLVFNYLTTDHVVPTSGMMKSIWSQERLTHALENKTFIQAKVDNFLTILVRQKTFFWSLLGSVLILWVILKSRRFKDYKSWFPFILGPTAIWLYYIIYYHEPFNLYVWYYPTIWLGGLLAIGIIVDWLLSEAKAAQSEIFHGILIGGLIVGYAVQVSHLIEDEQEFHKWIRLQSFEDTFKYHSWQAARYIKDHTWPTGTDHQAVFGSADAGLIGWVLDEPVVNLDGLINNEILEYELQGKDRYQYAIEKPEIDYIVNVFHKDWLPSDEFKEHFALCYSETEYSRSGMGFRIYGRRSVIADPMKDLPFNNGCVERVSVWWAGELPSRYDSVTRRDYHKRSGAIRCITPDHFNGMEALTYGPYKSLPAGNYAIDYYLEIDAQTDSIVAHIDVIDHLGRVIAETPIEGMDFDATGEFQRFTLPFRITENKESLEFRVFYTGQQALCVQGIMLRPTEK